MIAGGTGVRLYTLLVAFLLAACDGEQAAPATDGIENRGSAAADDSEGWWAALPRQAWGEFEQLDTGDTWFEVYRIRADILAIYEPGQFEEVISWLILGRDRALLFDTGLGIGDIKALVGTLTDLPVAVLNSHAHYDHVGGNYQFEAVMGRDHPYSRKRSAGLSSAEVGDFARGDWIWKPTPPGFDREHFATRGWAFTDWVEEGQFIDLGGVSLEVVYSPGHAPDCLVLIDHRRRLMFTGDTFYLAPLYAHLPGSNFTDYAASARKLADLAGGIDTLLTSHNTPTAAGDYLIKLEQAFQAVADGSAPYTRTSEGREYRFENFAILTTDPPVPRAPEGEAP